MNFAELIKRVWGNPFLPLIKMADASASGRSKQRPYAGGGTGVGAGLALPWSLPRRPYSKELASAI